MKYEFLQVFPFNGLTLNIAFVFLYDPCFCLHGIFFIFPSSLICRIKTGEITLNFHPQSHTLYVYCDFCLTPVYMNDEIYIKYQSYLRETYVFYEVLL